MNKTEEFSLKCVFRAFGSDYRYFVSNISYLSLIFAVWIISDGFAYGVFLSIYTLWNIFSFNDLSPLTITSLTWCSSSSWMSAGEEAWAGKRIFFAFTWLWGSKMRTSCYRFKLFCVFMVVVYVIVRVLFVVVVVVVFSS